MTKCNICKSTQTNLLIEKIDFNIYKCNSCQSQFIYPIPSMSTLNYIYNNNYFIEELEDKNSLFSKQKQKTADMHISLLMRYVKPGNSKILEVGSGYGDFIFRASSYKYNITGVEYSKNSVKVIKKKFNKNNYKIFSGEISNQKFKDNSFDAIVFFDVMEHVVNVDQFMKYIKKFLKKDGVILLSVPSLDSLSAKILRNYWMEYKLEHLRYFNRLSLKEFLNKSGFDVIHLAPDKKNLSMEYINDHFQKYPIPGINLILSVLKKVIPNFLYTKSFNITASGVIAVARKSQ